MDAAGPAPLPVLAELAELNARPLRVPVGAGPTATQLLRRAASAGDADGLVCLQGEWAGGGGIVAARPLVVLPAGSDPIAALGVSPRLVAAGDGELIGGGWFGWLAYDGASWLGFYDHLWRVGADGQWWFEALWSERRRDILARSQEQLAALLAGPTPDSRWTVGTFAGASMPAHLTAVEGAIGLIRAGEIYQVNVCARLGAHFTGDTAGFFAEAADGVQPAYAAYVAGGDRAVAGLSPELFLRRRGRAVTTSPIKGTWTGEDPDGAQALSASTKDAAENVMIVDLMRNDLGRVCEVGTVRASSLLDVQPHVGVWQLVSTVAGRLREEIDDAVLLRATFPPGSVTGAPKLRAMSAIDELESAARAAYTGAIGFASPCWGVEWAVVIRSFEIADGRVELGVGGGVTADSVPMLEWQECLHKAAPLLATIKGRLAADVSTDAAVAADAHLAGGLLETLACRDGVPVRLADHLARLDRSARELYRHGLPEHAAATVRDAARQIPHGRAALRVRLGADGELQASAAPAGTRPTHSALHVVRGRNGLWRHKWADRTLLDALGGGVGVVGGSEALFVAADGTVLETGRGNVFLLLADGTLITPPLRDDLLPGVARRALLDQARSSGRPVQLRAFGVDELRAHAAFWTSSLSAAVPIHSIDGVALPRSDEQVAAFAAQLAPG